MDQSRSGRSVRGQVRPQQPRPAGTRSRHEVYADADPLGTISALAGAAIALGARALTSQQLETAQLTNELLRRHLDEPFVPAAIALARSFHGQLLGACPNVHMVELLADQLLGIRLGDAPHVSRVELERAADEHDQLLEMVRADEPLRAIERFARHHADGLHLCCG